METRVPPFVVNCSNLHKIFVIPNKNLRRVFNDYSFLYIPDEKTIDQNIYDEIKKSKIIIMDHYSELNRSSNDIYFIICINKMILIIKNSKSFDQLFLEIKSEKEIYFLSDTKDILGENIQYFESKKNQYLDEEISNFNEQIEILKSTTFPICFCKSIRSCITTYLIEQSYSKLNNDRIQLFYSNQIEKITPKTINDDEYIELRSIGSGSSCHVYLIYHIIDEKLLVIKKIQQENLYEREKNNYLNMNHPFIPKFYGFNSNKCSLFIEYINGKTLLDINMLELSEKDFISFILQLLRVFSYLHSNNFIYRDLKPNNIMIDQNKTIVLIDFDQMIKDDNDGEHTINFNSVYIAPEIFKNKLTKKSDIFSIGQLIYYFKKNKHPNKVLSNNLYGYPIIDKFYEQLTKMNPEERPDISEFINDFHIYALAKNQIIDRIDREDHYLLGLMCKQFCEKNDTKYINKAIQYLQFAANLNHPISLFLLGVLYYEGKYISNNISNAIYYFSLAAKQNITDAYHNLGLIYYENKYVKRDINKAIYYFNIASNNNHAQSQYNLGFIYYKGQYIKQDIEKAINYFSLAAEQKDVQAQYNLGLIYSNGKYVKQDMDKAIYYFKLASDQNHPISQNKLGSLYYIGQYVEQNINTAINLFSLSAKQNYPESQFILGCFYLDGKYVEKNINKAIDLLTRAANQNCVLAQNTLGSIYFRSDYVIQDINNAIYYLSLAANQNHPDAQYQLGFIYAGDEYVKKDINKAIYYLSLAANQNHLDAQYELGLIYSKNEYANKDINKSIYYLSRAADQNHLRAQFNLGILYLRGKYLEQNINKSIYYLSLAADQNYIDAQFELGFIYLKGKYIEKDINKSIYYLSRAAQQNHLDAQYDLGLIYYKGIYVKKDINKAIYYFQLASNQNHSISQFNLGIIYYLGYFVERDINKAIYFLSLSANGNNVEAML